MGQDSTGKSVDVGGLTRLIGDIDWVKVGVNLNGCCSFEVDIGFVRISFEYLINSTKRMKYKHGNFFLCVPYNSNFSTPLSIFENNIFW